MLTSRNFYLGVLVGVGGVYAFHRWGKALPSNKTA